MSLDGVDHSGDDHGEDDVPSGGVIIYISISISISIYLYLPINVDMTVDTHPLKFPRSAMAPDTMVAQVAAKVHCHGESRGSYLMGTSYILGKRRKRSNHIQ